MEKELNHIAKLMEQVGFRGMWIEQLLGDPDFIRYTSEYIKKE